MSHTPTLLGDPDEYDIDELMLIDWENVCLLDEYPDLWRRLLEHRGGCCCHLNPPCGPCSEPLTEKEIAMLEKWRAEPTSADPVWVPWSGGECPVPREARCDIRTKHGHYRSEYKNQYVASLSWWESGEIVAYRLANPTPRGPCVLPPDHPHAEAERLWRSDDTLKAWYWDNGGLGWPGVWVFPHEGTPIWNPLVRYHVGHQWPEDGG